MIVPTVPCIPCDGRGYRFGEPDPSPLGYFACSTCRGKGRVPDPRASEAPNDARRELSRMIADANSAPANDGAWIAIGVFVADNADALGVAL